MIIVTGANGKLGSRTVARLLDRMPADQIGVSVRDPAAAGDLAARGVRVRRGDYADPESLADAFEGATQVLLVSAGQVGEAAVTAHRAAIDAAGRAGAGRILYTSHQAADPGSRFAPAVDHAATEAYLDACGTPWTSLRNGFYANTVTELLLGSALETGDLRAPADGPVSWTTRDDLAETAAAILAGPGRIDPGRIDPGRIDPGRIDAGRFDGATPPLTAAEALDLDDVAGLVSDLTGRTIRRVVIEDAEWVGGLVSHGVPEAAATMLLGLFLASRDGEFAVTDPTLAELVGRPAVPLRAVLEGHLQAR